MIGELGLDLGAYDVRAFLVDENFYTRLEFIVAPSFEIIDPENCIGVGEEIGLRQEVADLMRDQGSAAQTAADVYGKADLAGGILVGLMADAVPTYRGT